MKIYDIKGMSRRLGVAVMGVAAAAVLVYFIIKPPAKKLFAQRIENTTEGGNEDE